MNLTISHLKNTYFDEKVLLYEFYSFMLKF